MDMTTIRDLTGGKIALVATSAMAAVAVALACGLCPGSASAAQLQAGDANVQDSALSAQAATKTVYVITDTNETADWGLVSKTTTKYTYGKNGLMTKSVSSNNMDGKTTTTYSYNGAVLKNKKMAYSGGSNTVAYTANKNGKITKAVAVMPQPNGKITRTYTAKYKSGNINKISWKEVFEMDGEEAVFNDACTYTYKNGRVASRTMYGSKTTYVYDAKGNLKNIGGSKYNNKYNAKKQLVKTTQSETGFKYTKTYKYKAIKVKASIADKVQAQQWSLINNNLNFAFGIDVL